MAGPPSTTSSSTGRRTSTGPGHSNQAGTTSTVPGTFGQGSTLAGQDFQSIADKLKSHETDFKAKNSLATELRDTIEMHQKDLDLAKLFEVLVPTVISILREGKPSMIGNSGENKFRKLLIEVLLRLPHAEPLRQYAPSLISLLLHLLRTENEENALLCMKTFIDLHRTYSRPPPPTAPTNPDGTPANTTNGGAQQPPAQPTDQTVLQMEQSVDEFLEIVAELFKNIASVVEETFSDTASSGGASASKKEPSQSPAAAGGPPALEADGSQATGQVVHQPAMRSFKFLQDCPASIVFIFQTYRPMVNKAIAIFVPLVFDFIQLQAAPQARKHASMEPGQSWVGICPEIPKDKRAAFESMVMAQTKTMSFLAYVHRVSNTALSAYLTVLPEIAIRLMKDCPSEAVAMKRDLIIATRHILQSELRSAFLTQIDTLLDDYVLTGNSVTGHENLRPLAYSMLADLIHHCRADLTLSQLSRVVHTYCANIHDPTLASAIQTMCSKLLLNLIDPIASKEPQEAVKILQRILLSFVSRMEAMAEVRDEWGKFSKSRDSLGQTIDKVKQSEADKIEWDLRNPDKGKGKAAIEEDGAAADRMDVEETKEVTVTVTDKEDKMDMDEDSRDKVAVSKDQADADKEPTLFELDDVDIERAKPVRKAVVMVDPGPDPVKDARFLFRNLLFGFKTLGVALSRMGGQGPDAELMCRFFDAAVKCMVVFDSSRDGGREQKEVMEVLSSTLVGTELVIFQEVLENRMGFFFDELIRNHELLVIPQSLLSNDQVSQHFVAILFRFLSDRLPDLGNNNKENTSVMLRLYKMSFMAVTIFPEKNEPVLLPHLTNLIMNSLKFAQQASEPNSYYLLLRALFRSIGGGRFEILYNEVLPSLQVLLEQLNALLKSADKSRKDLFAELILTVPVRLSVLLPYLSYLMRPLVHALQAGTDLISQGLRTLELCVDNLTQEFLGPLMAPVIDEVMVGLWKLLRPLPFNHQHAHTTMRILGKIGGRNRKGFEPPKLEWKASETEALLNFKFEGKDAAIRITPLVDVALKIIKRGDLHYRRVAYQFLKYSTAIFVRQALPTGEPATTFGNVLRGLYEATRIEEFADEANKYIIDVSRLVFDLETGVDLPEDPAASNNALLLSSALLDGITENLCSVDAPDLAKASEQTLKILEILVSRVRTTSELDSAAALVSKLMSRLACICYDSSWQRKTGAAMGINLLSSKVDLSKRTIAKHSVEIVRGLVFAIKDMPGEAPSNSQMVIDTLYHVVRVCNEAELRKELEGNAPSLHYLCGLLLLETCSQIATVREVSKQALDIISEVTKIPLAELLLPVRDRLLQPIWSKPLRALEFTMQIGHIDAVTYCVTRNPPLIEIDEKLIRILHEALGIADAEDSALLGGKATHKTMAPLTHLRVVSVQLLSATLANPQFNTPAYNQYRIRALSIYFKLLYAKSPEVVDAAYQSLKQVMISQGKLPKDLLQTGLKPVLMNLADHKKLSVASLQGLARLLELLPNYFKVEIGIKLVEHYRKLAVPSDLLRASAKQPSEDGELEVMAAIVNVFHLLPSPAAGQYLEEVIKMVVDVERLLKKLKTSIFTIPLSKFARLHPAETTNFFFGRLSDERFVTTFRAIVACEHAQSIRENISSRVTELFDPCFEAGGDLGYHAALVIKELILFDKEWIVKNDSVLSRLIQRWVSDVRRQRLAMQGLAHVQQLKEDAVVVEIFISFLEQAEHIDLLFHVVDSYTYSTSADHTVLSRFLNRHVALSSNVTFKRAVLDRFIDIFENSGVTDAHKSAALRLLVNPILLISFSRGARESGLIDVEWISKVHKKIWQPLLAGAPDIGTLDEEELRVELCHMSTQLVRNLPDLINSSDSKKDVIKFGWVSIRFDDVIASQSAYLLIASFLSQFESPTKIILQIYLALLRAHQAEARKIVSEALDILAPALPKRIPSGNSASGQTMSSPANEPIWAKWTRKVLVDEGSQVSLLINVYQLIVRHPDLFFSTRELFLPHMVASLGKLTLNTGITSDTRVLTLDVIELILKWEKKRLELTKQEQAKIEPEGDSIDQALTTSPKREKKADRAGSIAPSTTSSGPSSTYIPPSTLRDQVVNNLLRFISNATEPLQRNNLVFRALGLLRELIGPSVWGESNVKLSFFQRTFANDVTEDLLNQLCNSAEVLNVVSSYKPADWHLTNIGILHSIVEKGFSSGEPRLAAALRPVVERLFEHLPKSSPVTDTSNLSPQAKAFVEWARSAVDEGLRSMNNLPSIMLILQSWGKVEPEQIDPFIPSLIRVFSRFAKEHAASTAVSSADPQLRLLVSSIEVLRQRVSYLNMDRRWFLSGIVTLVEKSSNVDVCRFLLQMTRKWVFDHDETYPTAKEKAGILNKMMSFETRNSEALQKEYLNLILDIYTDPTLARSDLTFRLESAFLMGCKIRDPVIRSKFLAVFDKSLPTGLFSRLHYIVGLQSWETLSETYWIHQALDLLLGAVDTQDRLFVLPPGASLDPLSSQFVKQLESYDTGSLIGAARKLLYADPNATHQTWIATFKAGWACLARSEQRHVTEFLVTLLMREYHLRSVDRRPNVVQTLLQAALACSPTLILPPHVVRYHARTFNAWHTGIELLQNTLELPREPETVKETAMDALTELYAELSEEDLVYGLWRRRAAFNETNAAISWEQIGEWNQAQVLYESAQITARTGVLPFSESELALWEDHWIVSAQKLQQWDVLSDMAKNEDNKELLLECAWRLADWNQERPVIEAAIESMNPVPTPRRRIFEAYLALLSTYAPGKTADEMTAAKKTFNKLCDEGIQLSLRKWYYLPETVTQAHVPLLQVFQQFVELQETQAIFQSLIQTTAANLDTRSSELKSILGTWRDRLPNLWDDVNIWSDLVAWRQHVFSAINKHYLPLVPPPNAPGGAQNASSFAYRGFHETAWIINRFAHVARKHHLNEVCITSLTKIYTLPNIEIQEAFLKLREQAKSHYHNPAELASGLEVINNTNLMYFNGPQKAEFFTLKGMFLAKLHLHDEANQTFNLAVSMDMTFAKAWAEWGEYQDRMFKENPTELTIAANAVSCYLQAAGLYKNAKVRKMLVRVLWLLSLDDANDTIAKAFENYKGEVPSWYWITFVPQLLLALSGQREARYFRVILVKIAKAYPQAVFYHLRTTRDEFTIARRQLIYQQRAAAAANGDTSGASDQLPPGAQDRYPVEYIQEILNILKTAFPLLALSLEMVTDQFVNRFRPPPEEDIYRLVTNLLNDALQKYNARALQPDYDGQLAPYQVANVTGFAENLQVDKEQFKHDFVTSKPTMLEFIERLRHWRDRYETVLKRTANLGQLANSSHWLVEFQYQKFDEIEMFGQYHQHEDNNNNFVRINHVNNEYKVIYSHGTFFRRLSFFGTDGSVHQFSIQIPAGRNARREERIMQLLRMLNCPLASRKESRKRGLQFNVPAIVPFSGGVRIIENDDSITSLQDVYEQHCRSIGISREDPILAFTERIQALYKQTPTGDRAALSIGRQEIYEEISNKMIPDTILQKYLIRTMVSPSDLWHFRKRMTMSMASFIFSSYVLSTSGRTPARMHISRSTGKLHSSEMVPSLAADRPEFFNPESVPFRFTPNIQRFIGPHGTEGLLMSSLMAIARCLTEAEHDLEHRLSIFVREETVSRLTSYKLESRNGIRSDVNEAVEAVCRRAKVMACKFEREKAPSASTPVNQSLIELFLQATSPAMLSRLDPLSLPAL
ncbi:histone acetyltransferase TRA1 [Sporobolomyces koalae]|uniref:histone acetyltransferase TRA1 n=1 Tax=Sporobolomyces koalae TaxID=500713 RepID=UPI00317ACA19